MNNVELIGRLTRDPETRYTSSGFAITTFSIGIDRPPKQDGTKEADYPRVKVLGNKALSCEKNLRKGSLVGVFGSIETGSYTDKDGRKVYTTDVLANRVEFLADWGSHLKETDYDSNAEPEQQEKPAPSFDDQVAMPGITQVDPDEFPF